MRVLIGCERSGIVREAFRRRGHKAISCDLLRSDDNSPDHIQGDVLHAIEQGCNGYHWDIGIFHPDCTFLTVAAEWAYKEGPYHQKLKPETLTGAARRLAREEAIEFTLKLWNAPIEKVVIENPIGVLSRVLGKPTQIIQPHQFGHDASKATCLWIRGLPPLVPTNQIAPRIANGRPRWANQTDSGQNKLSPSDTRAADRARTYQGIGDAFAGQWG